jgi:hypothetical protein
MCMTLIVSTEYGAIAATDTRHYSYGDPSSPLPVAVTKDFGGKLRRGRTFWWTQTGCGMYALLLERSLGRFELRTSAEFEQFFREGFAQFCAAAAREGFPTDEARDSIFMVATDDGMAGSFRGDGRRCLWGRDGAHVSYAPGIPDGVRSERFRAFRAASARASSSYTLVRAVAAEFAWCVAHGGDISRTVEIGGPMGFISAPAAELRAMGDAEIGNLCRVAPAPVPHSVYAEWQKETMSREVAS